MNQFLTQNPEIAIAVITILGMIVAFLIKKNITQIEKDVDGNTERITIVENNYKKEFKNVRAKATEDKEEILKALTSLQVSVTRVESAVHEQSNVCLLIQEQKKK